MNIFILIYTYIHNNSLQFTPLTLATHTVVTQPFAIVTMQH